MSAVHRAVEFIDEEKRSRECRVCGRPVTGYGPTLRHVGEREAVVVPDPLDAESYARAVDVATAAIERLGPGVNAAEEARAAVAAVYEDGLLRRRQKHAS